MKTEQTHCEYDGTVSTYNCAREEQCDDCFMIDHLKECSWCEHYDHPEKTVMDSFNKLQDSVKKLEQLINEPIPTYGPERKND